MSSWKPCGHKGSAVPYRKMPPGRPPQYPNTNHPARGTTRCQTAIPSYRPERYINPAGRSCHVQRSFPTSWGKMKGLRHPACYIEGALRSPKCLAGGKWHRRRRGRQCASSPAMRVEWRPPTSGETVAMIVRNRHQLIRSSSARAQGTGFRLSGEGHSVASSSLQGESLVMQSVSLQ